MDFFDQPDAESKSSEDFINHVCHALSVTKDEFREQFSEACVRCDTESPIYKAVFGIFNYDCFSSDRFRMKKAKMLVLTQFFEYLIAGDLGIQNMGRKLKEYDYSARCSLVWTSNYFAYRCRTCAISPSMSLCSSCFNAGNHTGHDFNKFKSLAGGACDCGDSAVMLSSGNCRYHGPDKLHNRPSPPQELVAPLRCLLPRFLPASLFWLWELCSSTDPTALTDDVAPALYVLHVLHACGWVTQKMIADVLINREVFNMLKSDCAQESAYKNYVLSVATNPYFGLPPSIANQELVHHHLLDAFLFCTIKLRFPESLVTFLIGLLAVGDFKEEFVHSYLNHYTRIASTVMISARTRLVTDWSLQMNNRIVHISVQLFSGEMLALRMVRERNLHYLLVHCLLNMCDCCRTRLDDHNNMVVNCDGPLIQNNVFWPFVSDLSNLVSHKPIVDVLVGDSEFLEAWTSVLRYMQFMNAFVLRERDHIEYETMAFYHAFTMEIEISANPMWSIWQHYRDPSEKDHCLAYASACLSTLRQLLASLGRLVIPSMQYPHPLRSPLSLHLPLMRHAACFMGLAVLQHGFSLKQLLTDYLSPRPLILWRFMDELANTLLGCHEVIIGYWIRNGQAVRQSVTHYMQSQFCYSFVDLDIFAFQSCASLMPPAYVLNSLLDYTRLLRGVIFYHELLTLVAPPEPRNLDRKPMALESWLTTLCWILDLRNNICLTEEELLKKELICVLAPEPRKRSDLGSLLPERCGTSTSNKNPDTLLPQVATYSGPSCDAISGNVTSGHYYLRPSLWHTDFDPVFHSLRVTSRRETAVAMEKYREHLRQRHGIESSSVIWPPYRTPKSLPSEFMGLDHILHSRHLHFLLFIQLSLYVYGDPLVTEESLAIIIHLLNRALDTPCRTTWKGQKCCDSVTKKVHAIEPMQVESSDDVAECTDWIGNEFDDDPCSNFFDEHNFDPCEDDDNDDDDEYKDSFAHSIGTAFRSPKRPSTSRNSYKESSRGGKRFRWDSSLLKCPYPPESSLHDNLGCWLMVEHQPVPRVALAPTVLATRMNCESDAESIVHAIPSLPIRSPKCDSSNVLVDNLLTLLIKAHARLYWSRISGSVDTLPKVLAGDAFVDPNAVVPGASSVGPTIDEEVGINQIQVNNDHLSVSSPGTQNSAMGVPSGILFHKMLPRCTAVLPRHDTLHQIGFVFGSSNNMASGAGGNAHPSEMTRNLTSKGLLELSPELRYFAACPPAYVPCNERVSEQPKEVISQTASTGICETQPPCPDPSDVCFDENARKQLLSEQGSVTFGDGASYIQRLLDKIATKSRANDSALRLFLARAQRPFDSVVRILRLQPLDDSLSSSFCPKTDIREETVGPFVNAARVIPDVSFSSTVSQHLSSISDSHAPSNPVSLAAPTPGAAAASREERKKAALDRRKRLMEQMASKQKVFAMTHLKDMESLSQFIDADLKSSETMYECVICQFPGSASSDMILLDMMCESGVTFHIRETPDVPQLSGRYPTEACGMFADPVPRRDSYGLVPARAPDPMPDSHNGLVPFATSSVVPASGSCQAPSGTVGVSVLSTNYDPGIPLVGVPQQMTPPVPPSPSPTGWFQVGSNPANLVATSETNLIHDSSSRSSPCYLESRRWWGLALPSLIVKCLPLLRSGLILQTCGHAVHRECFQRYRSQGASRTGPGRNRVLVSCPLCRRDVDHLLPLVPLVVSDKECSRSPVEHILALQKILTNLAPDGKSIWEDLNGSEDETIMQRRTLMSQLLGERFEATVLLRSQLESELSVLMSCPSQYSVVARRCSWREFLSYCRLIYKRSSDFQCILQCLTSDVVLTLDDSEPVLSGVPIFALCQDPGDILLTLLPYVWPREDLFLTLVAATFCLAYVRALISGLVNMPNSYVAFTNDVSIPFARIQTLASKLSGPIAAHVHDLLPLLRVLHPSMDVSDIGLTDVPYTADNPDTNNRTLLYEAARLAEVTSTDSEMFIQSQFELHVVMRILPLLRLASLCRARWQTSDDRTNTQSSRASNLLVPMGLPFVGQLIAKCTLAKEDCPSTHQSVISHCPHVTSEQRLLEFSDLSRILSLDCGDMALINVALVAELAAFRSGLVDQSTLRTENEFLRFLMHRWFSQFGNHSTTLAASQSSECTSPITPNNKQQIWTENLYALVEVGRQLYPPRLIRPPYCFDLLFNALHLVGCDTVEHRFQENALCLICGRLMCTLCTNLSTVMVEHAYSCEGFSGVALEVNTSIVYVSLGSSVCDWGSIYLDAYGEEDLELKRGKPLFLNEERFALLENQWLSHSFRHFLKHWRAV